MCARQFGPHYERNSSHTRIIRFVKAGKAHFNGITGYDLKFLKEVTDNYKVHTVLSFSLYNLHDVGLLYYLDDFDVTEKLGFKVYLDINNY